MASKPSQAKPDLATFFNLGTVKQKDYTSKYDISQQSRTPQGPEAAALMLGNEDKLALAKQKLESLRRQKRQREFHHNEDEESKTAKTPLKKMKTKEESDDESDGSDASKDSEISDLEEEFLKEMNGSDDLEAYDEDDMQIDKVKSQKLKEGSDEESDVENLTEEEKLKRDKRLHRQATRKRKAELRAKERESSENIDLDEDGIPIPSKKQKKKLTDEEREEVNKRTLYVGNVPVNAKQKDLKKLFSPYGTVESVRLRNITVLDPDKRKHSIFHSEFHPDRDSMIAYVVFESDTSIKHALKLNGTEFGGKHLKVDTATQHKLTSADYENCVYVSCLPFAAEEEDLREIFQRCGNIVNIRIVRDSHYKVSRGFGYIRFTTPDAMNAAIKLNLKVTYKDKTLMVAKAVNKSIQNQDESNKGKSGKFKRGGNQPEGKRLTAKFKSKFKRNNSFGGNKSKSK